jgi:hypothetical protein
MNTRHILLLVCLLGFSSLAFAGLDVSIEQVNADGQIVADNSASSRLLQQDYTCTFILYSKEAIQANGGLLPVLNIFGPPYDGSIDNLGTLGVTPSVYNDLYRIVYQGSNCDCTVTIYQDTDENGKSKDYYTTTDVDSSAQTALDIDYCWAKNAASLVIQCNN